MSFVDLLYFKPIYFYALGSFYVKETLLANLEYELDFLYGCIVFIYKDEDEIVFVRVLAPYIKLRYSSTVSFLLSSIDILICLEHTVYYYTFLNCLTTSCESIY